MELEIISPKYGKFTCYYDDEDHELICKYKWGISVSKNKNFKVNARISKTQHSSMHKLVLRLNETKIGNIIHIDGNPFNNKKSNLLYVNAQEIIFHSTEVEIKIWWNKKELKSILIDIEDFELINNYKWCISKQRKTYYAYAKSINYLSDSISMHRLIMNFPDELQVDHKNHNGLDNRKCNLRIGTNQQNNSNKGIQSNNKSGYKGVHFNIKVQKYETYINVNKKKIKGGFYDNIIEAALKYNEMAKIYHGEFAFLNIIKNE